LLITLKCDSNNAFNSSKAKQWFWMQICFIPEMINIRLKKLKKLNLVLTNILKISFIENMSIEI
tara:strand:- start:822 stop:1013 length:192 start_codon:yes stop_codon:yes gene_type:complete